MESLKPEHLKNNSLYGAIAVAFAIVLAVGSFWHRNVLRISIGQF